METPGEHLRKIDKEESGRLAAKVLRGEITADEYCEKFFGGAEFTCRWCKKVKIKHYGVCDACDTRLEAMSSGGVVDPGATAAAGGEAGGDPWTALSGTSARLKRVGVPKSMVHADFDSFEVSRAVSKDPLEFESLMAFNRSLQKLKNWKGRPPLVVLSGPAGTGKTHLAVSILKAYVEKHPEATTAFWEESELIEAIQQTYTDDRQDPVWRFHNSDLVILDDFGSSRDTEYSTHIRTSHLRRRIDERKLTVITTNRSHYEINEMDERLGSRVKKALVLNHAAMPDHRGEEEKYDVPF